MTDVVLHQQQQTSLTEQMHYAQVVSTGNLLPQAYRGKPADILIALGLGQAMGLSPAESLYRIDVIQGKPTASAELIAANVRKAGHTLRVRVDEAGPSATATIIRADDPGYEHTVTRDADWAKRMGLDTKDNYRKQPATMLQWRAITGVARLACPEALYGVNYSSDEVADLPRVESAPRATAADFLPAEPVETPPVVEEPQQPETDVLTPAQSKKMHALFGKLLGGDRAAGLAFASDVVGSPVTTTKALTKAQATDVIDALVKEEAAGSAAEPQDLPLEPVDEDPWAVSA